MTAEPLTPERAPELHGFAKPCTRFRCFGLVLAAGAGIGALLAGSLVAAGSSMTRHDGVGTAQKLEPLAVGQVCRMEFAVTTIESCGNAGLGDLRFNCSRTQAAPCPTSTAITLENMGDDVVTLESDSGTPSHVVVTSHRPLQPRTSVTIVPRKPGDFIFEIDVEGKADCTAELRVIDIV